jgi:hypothetical protein
VKLWKRNAVAWLLGGSVGYFAGNALRYYPKARALCSVVVCGLDLTPFLVGLLVAGVVAVVVWYWLE